MSYAQTPVPNSGSTPQKSNPDAQKERSGYDPLLDLPPLPKGKLTVVGGTVANIDPVTNRLVLRNFGGGRTSVVFDMRTKILRNGTAAAAKDIQPGSRVYVDTMLKGDQVFAKSIRIETQANVGDARGQVVAVDTGQGILKLREEVAPEPFQFRLTPETSVMLNGRRANPGEILPGALITVNFSGSGAGSVAREVHVLANPGQNFIFAGKITFLDLRLRRIAIANQSDNETYDITLDRLSYNQTSGLRVGSDAVVRAVFNGKTYEAQNVEMGTPNKNNEARQ